ncbi:hypothetical protein EJ04DRAFT_86507 [Polyplosphaeria fusca]|uniref:Rhodopsin domain-containing protein n=1 Tax=Polyplosphaeria fusca TaxID=682080 RepID=A0A9P4V4H6_9PLEO|nr:hypothetical protein EJ04DRAFT_86507 [Polyplosphaeria fusca]
MAPNVGLGTEGPDQRGWTLWIVSVVGVVLSAVFVGARILQRIVVTGLGMDDYVIIAALVASGLLSLAECQAVVYGYGRKYSELSPETRITARKWFYIAQVFYKTVPTLNKVSVVCLYYRIFGVSSKWFRNACHVANAFIISAGFAFTVATVFQCTPIAAFWDKSIHPFRCFQNEPWWISFSVVQIVTDFALLALPLREVLRLSMTKAEKIGLCFVFGTGLFVTFASIFRATTIAASASDPDPTRGPLPATVWSVIEVNAGIICACLPMLRHPFLKFFGPLFGSRNGRSTQRSYQLTSRSHQHSGALHSGKAGPTDELSELERESEERIMGISSGQAGIASGRHSPEGALGGGIMIKNEFSVTRSMSPEGRKGHTDKSEPESVNEDKESGRSTFLHV